MVLVIIEPRTEYVNFHLFTGELWPSVPRIFSHLVAILLEQVGSKSSDCDPDSPQPHRCL